MLREFEGKVAVITGAAGGIGRGLAEKSVTEGMKVVLADVEEAALRKTEAELRARGGDVIAVLTDVSRPEQVQHLAEQTLKTFGAVHLLCNNAGVGAGGLVREHTLADWQWVLGVNLFGVIYGVHTFLPVMLKQGVECHIVNTASVEGLWSRLRSASYQVSKHGVVALSEVLKLELAFEETRVGVSVLCPGAVNTGIVDSGRNRPTHLQNPIESIPVATPEMEKRIAQVRQAFASGMNPLTVADQVFNAIREDRFYILTHPELNERIQQRIGRILTDGVPLPDFTLSTMPQDMRRLFGIQLQEDGEK
ncbi:MAG: SDR family NAD(P)-dependent oxidoreductase [Dehalococcoidia bacterium]|nr:SDR family NAD(P)-dependent oxidoreductase [Dehalococcoidia bacterium]